MIKTGIYNLEQIENQRFKSFLGGDKRISITLYEEIISRPNSEKLAERILLLFTDERGAYKRTYHNRFVTFDAEVLEIVKENFPQDRELSIQDVGISDGRTAVDFYKRLSVVFSQLNYQASDYNPMVYVISHGNTKITMSHNNKIIEIVWPPFVFNVANPDVVKYHPLNRVIQYFVEKIVVAPIMRAYLAGNIKSREICLFCPAALNLAKQHYNFNLLQQNVLLPFKHKSHILRAMNLLNPTYFTKPEFQTVIKNFYDALYDNGLLIVGSNQDSGTIVHGAVYRKSLNGFLKVWQSGNGPSVDHLICENS